MKNIKLFVLILLALSAVLPELSEAAISIRTTPSSMRVSRGRATAAHIIYTVTGGPASCVLTSGSRTFLSESMDETTSAPLSISVSNGVGTATETVQIPVRVLDRLIAKRENSFLYKREFVGCDTVLETSVSVQVTTETGADFSINRIALYFDNKRPEITVERNFPNLKAYADLQFVGTGLLQGYWEVDGRIISRVNQHVSYGRSITLQTPEIPSLPTFDEGSHIIRFVITTPATGMQMPSAVYFVTAKEYRKLSQVRLLSPADKTEVPHSSLRLEWAKSPSAGLSLIVFYEKLEEKPVFSAYTREASYVLPEPVLNGIMATSQRYYWKVLTFDEGNNLTGESVLWSFTFQK